jgi:hypothetical protein
VSVFFRRLRTVTDRWRYYGFGARAADLGDDRARLRVPRPRGAIGSRALPSRSPTARYRSTIFGEGAAKGHSFCLSHAGAAEPPYGLGATLALVGFAGLGLAGCRSRKRRVRSHCSRLSVKRNGRPERPERRRDERSPATQRASGGLRSGGRSCDRRLLVLAPRPSSRSGSHFLAQALANRDPFSPAATPQKRRNKGNKATLWQMLLADPAKLEPSARPRVGNDVVGGHRCHSPQADEQRRAGQIDPAP